jgi:hypothetical protein
MDQEKAFAKIPFSPAGRKEMGIYIALDFLVTTRG